MDPRPALPLLLLLTCLLATSLPVFAQDELAFDPARDLPGFETARSSQYKDLYPIDFYSDLLGQEVDGPALEKLRAQWKTESGSVDQHLAELTTNPKVGTRWLLSERMARHPFFSKVALFVDDSTPPFLIFVQKPALDDPAYPPAVVDVFKPFLVRLAEVFDARLAKKARVAPRPDRPWYPIAILASSGDLQNYHRLSSSGANPALQRTDSLLGMVVGFVNSFDKPKASIDVLAPILHQVFFEMVDAHVVPPAETVHSVWLEHGLANVLAYPHGARVEGLGKAEPRGADLRRLVEACHDANTRQNMLFPVAQLAGAKDWGDVTRLAFGETYPASARFQALRTAFQAQAALWMHFLFVPENGKYRASFEQYLEMAFKGAAGTDAMRASFPGTKLEDLDREFWSWVYDEHQRAFPGSPIDRSDLTDLFAKPVKGVDEIVARARASVAADPPEPPFVPATLAISDNDVDARHGMALLLARSGDFEGARAALEAVAATGPAVPDDGRVARDIARLDAAIQLRAACLEALAAQAGRITLERDGRKVLVSVAKLEDGAVVFAENKHGITSLPVTALDPAELVRLSEKKEMQGEAPAWIRPWLMLIVGDGRWDKLLKGDAIEVRDLREDGNVWVRDRIGSGTAALAVDALSRTPLPKNRVEAEPIVAAVTMLMSEHASAPCVLFKRSGLERMARAGLVAMSAEVEPHEFVHGAIASAADGAMTLTYEFADPEEARDFRLHRDYLSRWRSGFPAVALTQDRASIAVREGNLVACGPAVWRMPLGMAAPLRVEIEFSFTEKKGEMHPAPYMALVLCDDGLEGNIIVTAMGNVHAQERETGRTTSADSNIREFFFDRKYSLAIAHEQGKIAATLDGKQVTTCEVGNLKKGEMALFMHGETDILVHRLVVTGKPDGDSLAALRHSWVADRLSELGF